MMLFLWLAVLQADGEACPGASQVARWDCAGLYAAQADAAMNRQWRLAVQSARERDDPAAFPGANLHTYDHLLRAQRAWLAFRDVQCESEADAAAGGQDQFVIDQQCAERLTRERTRQLKDMTEWQN